MMSGSRFNFSFFPLNFVVVDFLGWFPPDNFPPDNFQIRQLPRGQVPDQKERLLQKVFRTQSVRMMETMTERNPSLNQ